MCKKRTGFIESHATVMARRGRRGANELAMLRHVLEKKDELRGKKEGRQVGIKYSLILELVFTSTRIASASRQQTA